jgi:hypothetical protein
VNKQDAHDMDQDRRRSVAAGEIEGSTDEEAGIGKTGARDRPRGRRTGAQMRVE